MRPLQCWATSETESSVTLVRLSGGGVVGGWGADGEEESERGQRRGRRIGTRGGRGRRGWGRLAWCGWPCLPQEEHGEALAVLGHKRDLLVGHLLALTVRWSCDGGGDALGAEIREDSGGGGACGRGGEARG